MNSFINGATLSVISVGKSQGSKLLQSANGELPVGTVVSKIVSVAARILFPPMVAAIKNLAVEKEAKKEAARKAKASRASGGGGTAKKARKH